MIEKELQLSFPFPLANNERGLAVTEVQSIAAAVGLEKQAVFKFGIYMVE